MKFSEHLDYLLWCSSM